ncbi:MAG: branched-chain amino acid ABC transporter permease [Microbacteriaceae bacterium]|nr:branched-chain amino acid ABC transporter permease [Microbacteriaceae bacterium]
MNLVGAVVDGILTGGVYALFAAGLSYMFGVMRLVNLAHGAFAVVAAYLGLVLSGAFSGLGDPGALLTAAAVTIPVVAAGGYLLQRFVLQSTLSESPLPSLLVTFGLAIIIENVLLVTMSADTRKLSLGRGIETASIDLGFTSIGVFPLVILLLAVVLLGGLSLVMARTQFGRLVRAVSDDPATVGLTGADPRHVYAIAAAIAFGLVAVAGLASGVQTNFSPGSGGMFLIFAFEAVIIGGLGSLWGTLLGAMILGVVQSVTAVALSPGYKELVGHLVFLLFLVFLPNGIIRRKVRL